MLIDSLSEILMILPWNTIPTSAGIVS